MAATPVRETMRALAAAVHEKSSADVTVGAARLDGLPLWKGLGLDYYQVHWYDQMTETSTSAPCTSFAALRARYRLDRPLVVGELSAGRTVDAAGRWRTLYAKGYAGAWAWSLFPEHTGDRLAIDLAAAGAFTRDHPDVGPHA